jgi:hypothetical protein
MEDPMSRWSRLIPILAVTVLLAACGQGTGDTPLSPAAPATPRMDGGLLVGGNATPPGPGDGSSTTTTQSTEAPGDSTARGGGLLVGGN